MTLVRANSNKIKHENTYMEGGLVKMDETVHEQPS